MISFPTDIDIAQSAAIVPISQIAAKLGIEEDDLETNLVQTLEGNPVILHGGPFASIAQGTNSILATKM